MDIETRDDLNSVLENFVLPSSLVGLSDENSPPDTPTVKCESEHHTDFSSSRVLRQGNKVRVLFTKRSNDKWQVTSVSCDVCSDVQVPATSLNDPHKEAEAVGVLRTGSDGNHLRLSDVEVARVETFQTAVEEEM